MVICPYNELRSAGQITVKTVEEAVGKAQANGTRGRPRQHARAHRGCGRHHVEMAGAVQMSALRARCGISDIRRRCAGHGSSRRRAVEAIHVRGGRFQQKVSSVSALLLAK
jgi:hypothetical protein